ncbi:MAG: type I methionyl aminopeptidase [Candidatus Vogelbacteria bacterium]|nr:type I methionyl aminopeptidase [Candidatus Vogelbacteria bacterium]
MGVTIKSVKEIEILREGGKRLSCMLYEVASKAKVGMSKIEIDKMAEDLIVAGGDIPAFKNYKPAGAAVAFPATLCISVGDEIVHGIPNSYRLRNGDIVGLDLGIKHGGLFTDMAVTVGIGEVDKRAKRLMEVTSQALEFGISVARAGATTGDIGYAIESFVRPYKYGIVRELSGHGVGHKIHEDPYVPNYGKPGTGTKLKPGMVLALEPMINEGSDDIILGEDDFTYKTRDGSRSAHFEKTILITEAEPEILTP